MMKQLTYSPTLKTATVRWSLIRKAIHAWNLIRATSDVFAIAITLTALFFSLTSINKYFLIKI